MELETLFCLDPNGRVLSTREPNSRPGPSFALIRSHSHCAWAVSARVRLEIAGELDKLAAQESLVSDFRESPKHGVRYIELLVGSVTSGPSFGFPSRDEGVSREVAEVTHLEPLQRHFTGWTEDELPYRAPIVAILENGAAVSVCFCARRTEVAAGAGLETAPAYRGRGLAAIVTTAWAGRIREAGLLPMYSTSWENANSLAVARKLGLTARAQIWSVA